jgi:hypothetical protein
MKASKAVLLLCLVCLPSYAAKMDTLPLVSNLKPGAVFQWRQVESGRWDRLTDNTVKCVVSNEPGNPGRLRLDLYETDPNVPDCFFASFILQKTSTNVKFYGFQFGGTAEDLMEYAVICNGGVSWPRYMTPDQIYHTTATFANGAGVPWTGYGCDLALYALEAPALKGLYELSIETSFGASTGLIVKPGVGVVGFEAAWEFYLAE